SEFIVIDETSKNDRTYARHYGRAPRGHRAQLTDVFVRGGKSSGSLSVLSSMGAAAILPGTLIVSFL
ncbi:hypothetical protein CY34DRAFT_103245, partial [Suillus luteus UH-Slu-Lm8-n1]